MEAKKSEKISKIYKAIAQYEKVTEDIYKESPVGIGDVLDWIENKWFPSEDKFDENEVDKDGRTLDSWIIEEEKIIKAIIDIRKDKRKPIDDNPEAIDFIYSLINPNWWKQDAE